MNKSISESRTYVAVCLKPFSGGYYFLKFTLPKDRVNTSGEAEWYFLNRLNQTACIEGCFSIEDFNNVKEVKTWL